MYITSKELKSAFKKVGFRAEVKNEDWINIARKDGMHCEFYFCGEKNYAVTATYEINGKDRELDFVLPDDLDLFVKTVQTILK